MLLANGDGIAIPHGNSDLVNKDSISVVRIKNTVEFGRMEDKDLKVGCSLVFNLALASEINTLVFCENLLAYSKMKSL